MKKGTGKIFSGGFLIFFSATDMNRLWFLLLLGIGLVFWGWLQRESYPVPRKMRKNNKTNEEMDFELETTITTSSGSNEIDTGPVKSSGDKGWIINPLSKSYME